jgi:hypothetical protein
MRFESFFRENDKHQRISQINLLEGVIGHKKTKKPYQAKSIGQFSESIAQDLGNSVDKSKNRFMA